MPRRGSRPRRRSRTRWKRPAWPPPTTTWRSTSSAPAGARLARRQSAIEAQRVDDHSGAGVALPTRGGRAPAPRTAIALACLAVAGVVGLAFVVASARPVPDEPVASGHEEAAVAAKLRRRVPIAHRSRRRRAKRLPRTRARRLLARPLHPPHVRHRDRARRSRRAPRERPRPPRVRRLRPRAHRRAAFWRRANSDAPERASARPRAAGASNAVRARVRRADGSVSAGAGAGGQGARRGAVPRWS